MVRVIIRAVSDPVISLVGDREGRKNPYTYIILGVLLNYNTGELFCFQFF
jgi:hypothetical protein